MTAATHGRRRSFVGRRSHYDVPSLLFEDESSVFDRSRPAALTAYTAIIATSRRFHTHDAFELVPGRLFLPFTVLCQLLTHFVSCSRL